MNQQHKKGKIMNQQYEISDDDKEKLWTEVYLALNKGQFKGAFLILEVFLKRDTYEWLISGKVRSDNTTLFINTVTDCKNLLSEYL